jgi:hypothetical protein
MVDYFSKAKKRVRRTFNRKLKTESVYNITKTINTA